MTHHIDGLIDAIKAQFIQMRNYYGSQLNEIEGEFDRERSALLSSNEDEVKQLFKIHKQTEEYFQMKRDRLKAEQAEKLEAARSEEASKQRSRTKN